MSARRHHRAEKQPPRRRSTTAARRPRRKRPPRRPTRRVKWPPRRHPPKTNRAQDDLRPKGVTTARRPRTAADRTSRKIAGRGHLDKRTGTAREAATADAALRSGAAGTSTGEDRAGRDASARPRIDLGDLRHELELPAVPTGGAERRPQRHPAAHRWPAGARSAPTSLRHHRSATSRDLDQAVLSPPPGEHRSTTPSPTSPLHTPSGAWRGDLATRPDRLPADGNVLLHRQQRLTGAVTCCRRRPRGDRTSGRSTRRGADHRRMAWNAPGRAGQLDYVGVQAAVYATLGEPSLLPPDRRSPRRARLDGGAVDPAVARRGALADNGSRVGCVGRRCRRGLQRQHLPPAWPPPRIMLNGGIGLLRTMPSPASGRGRAQLRVAAKGLGGGSDGRRRRRLMATVDLAHPRGAALLEPTPPN